MNDLEGLTERIRAKDSRIAVVGLGYVGVPVAVSFAAAGFDVVGIDQKAERADSLNGGALPLATSEPGLEPLLRAVLASGRFRATTDADAMRGREVAIVAVDTPVRDHRPDLTQLLGACRDVAARIQRPALVVIESTLAPGTMRGNVEPLFGEGIFLAYCPERVRPGRLLRNLRGMARLVAAKDSRVTTLGTELYGNVVEAELVPTDWETAEVVKTAENAARDVQIALGNQLAVIADHAGVDVRRVREQINRLWADQPLILEPGPGVGGHCLPKDPWLLTSALPADASRALIEGARALNDAMPAHAAAIALHALEREGIAPATAVVALLGLTYEAGSDDQRNAPGPRVGDALAAAGVRVVRHDPYLGTADLRTTLRGADLALVAVPHPSYREADWAALGSLMRHRLFVDCRRAFEADTLRTLGFSYRALGVAALR